jgi:hypothetical protein
MKASAYRKKPKIAKDGQRTKLFPFFEFFIGHSENIIGNNKTTR